MGDLTIQPLESVRHFKTTDNKWRIIVEEVNGKEDFEELGTREADHAWREAKVAEAREKKLRDSTCQVLLYHSNTKPSSKKFSFSTE